MRKALLGLLCSALIFTGCGDDEDVDSEPTPGDEDNPTFFVADDPMGSFNDAKFGIIEVEVPGQGRIPCIVYKDHKAGNHRAYSGIDCDWSEHDGNPAPATP